MPSGRPILPEASKKRGRTRAYARSNVPQESCTPMGLLADISDRFGGTEGMMQWLAAIPACDPSECQFHGWSPDKWEYFRRIANGHNEAA